MTALRSREAVVLSELCGGVRPLSTVAVDRDGIVYKFWVVGEWFIFRKGLVDGLSYMF